MKWLNNIHGSWVVNLQKFHGNLESLLVNLLNV